ncbi:MAG: aldehyde dehydrogenase family protein, partial [Candidatus Aminicenantes bacterium]|nr:aldehyde dehydrogenase family protein [Candidatus Aminicenantes bacterium]
PENCIQWIKSSTREETAALMAHPKTALVIATGSVDVVRAALNSGKPVIGIGPGNVPVFIDSSAEIATACEAIISSKTFDLGTVCASEQALIVLKDIAEKVKEELIKKGAYFLSPEEIKKLEPVAYNSQEGVMRVEVIGQPASKIATLANFEVPETTSVLIAPLEIVGPQSPLSMEILAPILAFYVAENENQAFDLAKRILKNGGVGHTASIFSTRASQIARFAREMPAGRILINTPAALGALGGIYNKLKPSFVLACGPAAGNIFMDNISVNHLFLRKKIVEPRLNPFFRKELRELYLNESITLEKLDNLINL